MITSNNATLQTLHIALITPALNDANNGNWQTAQRWAGMLGVAHAVDMAKTWDALPAPLQEYDAMIALHARRSAASVAAFAAQCQKKPLWVVLTGTDLYRDIAIDSQAQTSLQLATQLIVLQSQGIFDLPKSMRHKAHTVFQSAPRMSHKSQSSTTMQVLVVGHLRAEKSPETTLALARLIGQNRLEARIQQVGRLLEPQYEALVLNTQAEFPAHYQWLGGLSHETSLELIAKSDLLFHPSAMEGGALAIIEAVQCGTPVIASRVAGHIGLLGADYSGFFDWGDAAQALRLIERFATDPTYQAQLHAQCAVRSTLFDPDTERQALLKLLTI